MKIKIFFAQLLLNLLFSATPLQGQTYSISGILSDKSTNEPLIGGYIFLDQVETNTEFKTVSELNGSFKIEGLVPGKYQFKASYIGYQTVNKNIEIKDQNINLGEIPFLFNSETLTTAEVIALQQRAVLLGDTTQYNANTYVANPDANAEDLLQKMPGFTVTDGKVAAQGETVTQVLVDGKPFFGDDPTTTLKNMPAEVISKIQVFDDESEESKATGFSDGNTQKTVNIILKEEYRNGKFGNFHAAYGYENKYNLNGNLNIFSGDRRISIIAQSNNINIQNFSSADLLGVSATVANGRGGRGSGRRRGGGRGPSLSSNTNDFLIAEQGGISKTNAVGINYQDKWGKKLEVIGSYFFNQSDNINQTNTIEEYFSSEFPLSYTENSETSTTNLNHRANLQMRYKFNKNNDLIIKPSLTIQQNNGLSDGFANTFSDKNLTNVLTETLTTDLSALKFSNEIFFTHRFDKRGRSLSFKVENGLNTSEGDKSLLSENTDEGDIILSQLNQNSTLDNVETSLKTGFRYTEPLGKNGGLMLAYEFGNQKNEAEVLTFDYNEETQDFDLLSQNLSSTFNNDYLSHQTDIGYRYRKGDFSMMLRTRLQTADLDNTQSFPIELLTQKSFDNILPSAFMRYNISKEKKLRISYRSSVQLPSVADLQEVIDNSSPLQLEIGNSGLNQQVNHSLNLRYSANNPEKATVFFAYLQASTAKDYLGDNTFIAEGGEIINGYTLTEGVQVTQAVNLSGYLSTRAFATYGMPVSKLKSNFNINLGGSFNRTPAQFEGREILTESQDVNVGLSLSSNISPEVDFTIGTTSNFSFAQGEYVTQTSIFYQQTQAKFNYIFSENWRAETNLTHNYYNSTGQNFTYWNASIGYKFLQDNRAEISLSVYDILNSNTAIEQNYTDTYFEQTESLALQRFVMLGFKYNLRAFNVPTPDEKGPPPPFR